VIMADWFSNLFITSYLRVKPLSKLKIIFPELLINKNNF